LQQIYLELYPQEQEHHEHKEETTETVTPETVIPAETTETLADGQLSIIMENHRMG